MADPSQYKFSCSICDKKFKQKQTAQRHERTVHGDVSHKCEICNISFNQLSNLTRHIITHKKRPLENVSYNSILNVHASLKRNLNIFQSTYQSVIGVVNTRI